MRHSAKKSTCDTQLFSRSHPRTPRGGWCEHWRALWGSFGAVSVGYAPTPFHVNPREGKGVNVMTYTRYGSQIRSNVVTQGSRAR